MDVFDGLLSDAVRIRRVDAGEGEDPRERFDRMARERLANKGGGSSMWWLSE